MQFSHRNPILLCWELYFCGAEDVQDNKLTDCYLACLLCLQKEQPVPKCRRAFKPKDLSLFHIPTCTFFLCVYHTFVALIVMVVMETNPHPPLQFF